MAATYSQEHQGYRQHSSHSQAPPATTSTTAAAAPPPLPTPLPPPPLSITKTFRPYYSPQEVTQLVHLQSAARTSINEITGEPGPRTQLSEAKVDQIRQQACGYIERVGSRLGFPRRTIATAQTLYHRFHLHFLLKDFSFHDVSLAVILVACKLEDTLKKLREIQIAGAQILNLVEGGPGTSEGDLAAQEAHRPILINIERLVLQTISFNFNLSSSFTHSSTLSAVSSTSFETFASRDIFTLTLRFCQQLAAPKPFAYLAHLLAMDLHRTLAPLSYPTHTRAVACIYLATFLTKGHRNCRSWMEDEAPKGGAKEVGPVLKSGWCERFESDEEDVQEIAHALLNLLILLCPSTPAASAFSLHPGATPSSTLRSPAFSPSSSTLPSPAEPPSHITGNTSSRATTERDKYLHLTGIPFTLSSFTPISARRIEDFTRIKIRVREESAATSSSASSRRKRPREWANEYEGLKEAEEQRVEADEKDREKRERFSRIREMALKGQGMTKEEEEKEERERRDEERARRPGSVRYRF